MVAATVLASAAIAARRLLARWGSNPDPLDGQPVVFPDGRHQVVVLPDGARIATVTVGEGPTIVCVHGLTSSRRDWGPMAPALLEAGFQLIAVDQRGHGDSTVGSAGFGSTQLGSDLAHVLEELDVHAAALMGHSMGGMAAMALAVDHPEIFRNRIDRLILIATAATTKFFSGSSLGLRLGGIRIPERPRPANKRLRLGAGVVFGDAPSLHMIDEAILSATRVSEDVRVSATLALRDHDVLDRLGAVDRPTLIIGGMKDRLIRPAHLLKLARAIPGSELHMLEGAGHMIIWERHSQLTDLVINFVRTSKRTSSLYPSEIG